MRKIYFQRPYVTIYFDQDRDLAGAVWKDFMSSEEFREAILQCINLIKEVQPTHWMADNRGLKAIRQADQNWMVEEVVPILGKSSIRKMASLVPADIFGQMAVESLSVKANNQLQYENAYFKHERDALTWLLSEVPYSDITHSDKHP